MDLSLPRTARNSDANRGKRFNEAGHTCGLNGERDCDRYEHQEHARDDCWANGFAVVSFDVVLKFVASNSVVERVVEQLHSPHRTGAVRGEDKVCDDEPKVHDQNIANIEAEAGNTSSRLARVSEESSRCDASTLIAKFVALRLPGIGTMCSPCASSHARANAAGDA